MSSHRAAPIVAALGAVAVACSGSGKVQLPCPYLDGTTPLVGTVLSAKIGAEAKGTLVSGKLSGHVFNGPKGTDLTLKVSVKLEDGELVPAVFVYGPRRADGSYGGCASQGGQGDAGQTVEVAVKPSEPGGDYLVLVGAVPLGDSRRTYTLNVTCDGAACGNGTCPTQAEQGCPLALCPSGFAVDPKTGCATCGCRAIECAPFRESVLGTCGCACSGTAATPVCGADGTTYASACEAQCAQVAIVDSGRSCEEKCGKAPECAPACGAAGRKVVSGCTTCDCADPCEAASARVEPVCGTDGLTWRNAAVARCHTGVEVAYLGPCEPACALPVGCTLSCEFGLQPKLGAGPGCFECACAEATTAFGGLTCDGSAPVCGVWPGAVDAAVLDGTAWKDTATGVRLLSTHVLGERTFANACAARKAGFVATREGGCGTTRCVSDADCAALVPSAWVPAGVGVRCDKPSGQGSGACRLVRPALPETCDPLKGDSCPLGATCVTSGGSARCRSQCACRDLSAGSEIAPVCAQSTTINACEAYCAKASSVSPGGCCAAGPLTVTALAARWLELDAYCKTQPGAPAALFDLLNACPPEPKSCTAATCCAP